MKYGENIMLVKFNNCTPLHEFRHKNIDKFVPKIMEHYQKWPMDKERKENEEKTLMFALQMLHFIIYMNIM